MLDVPANSPSALACSEFAVGWDRWHGRIACVMLRFYFFFALFNDSIISAFISSGAFTFFIISTNLSISKLSFIGELNSFNITSLSNELFLKSSCKKLPGFFSMTLNNNSFDHSEYSILFLQFS